MKSEKKGKGENLSCIHPHTILCWQLTFAHRIISLASDTIQGSSKFYCRFLQILLALFPFITPAKQFGGHGRRRKMIFISLLFTAFYIFNKIVSFNRFFVRFFTRTRCRAVGHLLLLNSYSCSACCIIHRPSPFWLHGNCQIIKGYEILLFSLHNCLSFSRDE